MMLLWQVLVGAGAIIGWSFVLRYCRRPWRESGVGWNLMLFTGMMAVVFTLLLVESIVGPFVRGAWLLVVMVVVTLLAHRLAILIDDDRLDREEAKDALTETRRRNRKEVR